MCRSGLRAGQRRAEGEFRISGGDAAKPSYKQVTNGGTGHREAVEIDFDPSVISRATLINMFLRSIDPTD